MPTVIKITTIYEAHVFLSKGNSKPKHGEETDPEMRYDLDLPCLLPAAI